MERFELLEKIIHLTTAFTLGQLEIETHATYMQIYSIDKKGLRHSTFGSTELCSMLDTLNYHHYFTSKNGICLLYIF
jgi:hypothetical protein